MKFANAIKIHRKSGVRFGERGAPVRFPPDRLCLCKVTGEGLWYPTSREKRARYGAPSLRSRSKKGLVEHYGYFVSRKALAGVAGIAGAYRGFVILVGRDFLFQDVR
jgi:hypothetical protein